MPHVRFGKKDEPGVDLVQSDDLIVVRTRSRAPLRRGGPVAAAAEGEVDDGQVVERFPEAGVEVHRVPTARKSLDDRKRALRESPDVRFAGGVLVDPLTKEPVLYTENFFVKFLDDADPDECRQVLEAAGLTVKRTLDFATNAFFASAPEGTGQRVFDMALALLERSDVEYCHPELIRRRARRQIAPQQWHLKSATIGGMTVQAHANVEAAHQVTRGSGVTIAVIDDGVDIDHPEFASPGKIVAPRDATQGTADPRPKDPFPGEPDDHGTAVAGVACADGTHGASGVAPAARLLPIRLASGLGSVGESEAFHWAADHGADVISCSWGPEDGRWFDAADPKHNRAVPLPASTRLALEYATTQGRGGKGCVILFAAGNGNERVENDGYASAPQVIAVAACNDRGTRSVYSDFGRAVWCSFPSSDFGHTPFHHPAPITPGIWTTDRVADAGYNAGSVGSGSADGNYCNDFGGTSSACPGAAGVAALVLSVNPALRSGEVRDILRRACDRIDVGGGAYDANGRSELYGFGRLNALTAVTLARPPADNRIAVSRTLDLPIPDLQTVEARLEVADAAVAQAVKVTLDLKHTFIGDLVVTLIPPPGLGSGPIVLHNRTGGAKHDIKASFDGTTTTGLRALAGKSCLGSWILRIQDAAAIDTGTLVAFGLEFSVAPATRSAPPAAPPASSETPPSRGATSAPRRL